MKLDKPGFQPLVVVSIFSIVLASKDAVKKRIERQRKYTVFIVEHAATEIAQIFTLR